MQVVKRVGPVVTIRPRKGKMKLEPVVLSQAGIATAIMSEIINQAPAAAKKPGISQERLNAIVNAANLVVNQFKQVDEPVWYCTECGWQGPESTAVAADAAWKRPLCPKCGEMLWERE